MHVTGTTTFEAESLQTVDGGIDIDKVRDYIASRLHLIPRYRQRLEYIPVVNHPVWVDDEHFNIHYHVRHIALPKPGDDRQLKRLAGRVMAQHLDRRKPLWEIWIVEGLANRAHFIMISKIHHCMVDGMSSVALLNVLLKPEPTDTYETLSRWMPRRLPSRWELASDAIGRYARLPLDIAKSFPQTLQEARDGSSVIRAGLNA
jgi:WS/DGAT/MGAT family acyltransferase